MSEGAYGQLVEGESSSVTPALPAYVALDILHLGDFRTPGETPWRIANLVRIEADEGYSVGLLHTPSPAGRPPTIHPLVDDLVVTRSATPLDPALPIVRARLVLVHGPADLWSAVAAGADFRLPRIVAERAIAIVDAAPDENLGQTDALLKSLFGPGLTWAAASAEAHEALSSIGAGDVDSWQPTIAVGAPLDPVPGRPTPVMGCILNAEGGVAEIAMLESWLAGLDGEAVVRVMESAPCGLADTPPPPGVQFLSAGEMHPRRFVAGLDFLAVPPGTAAPAEAIAWAMAHGAPVMLTRALAKRFGGGPVYAGGHDMFRLAKEIHADAAQRQLLRTETAEHGRISYPASAHVGRLRRLVGGPAAAPRRKAAARPRKRVLFVSSNGFGLGHLARLLAIARRMPAGVEPVFATMSQAMGIVRQAGYPAEYLPANVFGNADPRDWNGWLSEQFAQILDFHRPAAVVFDGGLPYAGILEAVATREDAGLVWIRRGMWRDIQSNADLLARQRFFDLVIEPADVAAASDRGATVEWRSHALGVPPIALLEDSELFERGEAAARLGLDSSRPAVLIQLGSGANRDIVGMTDEVLKALSARSTLQPVLLEWLIASAELNLWPGVKRLKGFPVTKYYRAFDFTISAAGYNSFNEIIAFGLPAIFVSNEHPMLDDQRGRASFAEENGAAYSVPETQLHAIDSFVDAILDDKVQWLMRANCQRLAQPNGAAEAAAAIAALARRNSRA